MESPEDVRGFFINACYGLNVCVLQNLYLEILMPNVMILVGGTFQRYLSHESGALMNGISTL